MSQLDFVQDAASQLAAVGFIVQSRVRAETIGRRTILIDIVAWAGAENGELAPALIVETKRSSTGVHPTDAASQLAYYLPLVGASRAYVFDGTWHLVSDDFQTTTPVDCPLPAHDTSSAVAPPKLIEQLLWNSFDKMRASGRSPEQSWQSVIDGLKPESYEWLELDPELFRLAALPQNGLHLSEALVHATQRFGGLWGTGAYVTPPALGEGLVRLLAPRRDWTIADPFCGLGTLLQSVQALATDNSWHVKLVGGDINAQIAGNAQQLLRLASTNAVIRVGDSLSEMPARDVDGIVTNPPFGLKLPDARALSLGGTTRDGMILTIDRVLTSLRDGGRAVLLVPVGFLFAGGASEDFRSRLAQAVRVVSIVEVSVPLFTQTNLRVAIVVLEKRPPSDTLVARLEDDWEAQLAESSEFMKAYRQHLGVDA